MVEWGRYLGGYLNPLNFIVALVPSFITSNTNSTGTTVAVALRVQETLHRMERSQSIASDRSEVSNMLATYLLC